MLEVLIGTGVRVGELLSLCVGDVEVGERSGKLTVRQSKHGGYREVPLTVDVRKALNIYLETHPKANDPNSPLWIGASGLLSHRSSMMHIPNKNSLPVIRSEIAPFYDLQNRIIRRIAWVGLRARILIRSNKVMITSLLGSFFVLLL